MEAKAPAEGQRDVPPPAAPVIPPPPPPKADNFAKICKDFRAMGGRPLHWNETSVEARNWFKDTEDLFIIFEVEDRRKIQLAAWLLKDEASFLWEVTQAGRPVETWEDFRQRFEMKFLSQAERSIQMERFLALKKGNLTVKYYVNKFNQLARFVLELVDTPHKRALRFAKGLNEPLHGLAMSHIPMGATYEKLDDMALMHEEDKGEKKEVKAEETMQNKKVWPKKRQQQTATTTTAAATTTTTEERWKE